MCNNKVEPDVDLLQLYRKFINQGFNVFTFPEAKKNLKREKLDLDEAGRRAAQTARSNKKKIGTLWLVTAGTDTT